VDEGDAAWFEGANGFEIMSKMARHLRALADDVVEAG